MHTKYLNAVSLLATCASPQVTCMSCVVVTPCINDFVRFNFLFEMMPHERLEHVMFSDSRQFLDVDMYRELDYKHAFVCHLFAST